MASVLVRATATVSRHFHPLRPPLSRKELFIYPPCLELSSFFSVAARKDDEYNEVHSTPGRQHSWNEMYQELRKFTENHGHAHVPVQYSENPSLAHWVKTQRHQNRLLTSGEPSALTLERKELLDELGMVWNVRDYMWEQHYEQLLDFYYTHGHVNVPGRYPGGLGRWLYKQRRDFAARQHGEETPLTTEKMVRLSALGMVWNIPEASWEEWYQQLVYFREEHGHTNVPADPHDAFANWVHAQRREYRRRLQAGEYSRMTQERIDKLNELQFQWDYQEAVWMEKYQELCRYQREHGDCIVPKTYPSLGRWVGQQREQYKKLQEGKASPMTPERIALLEKIDFCWNAQDALWRQRLEELKELVKTNGFGSVPPTKTHLSLNRWLQRQLLAYEKMKDGKKVAMNEERAAELRKLGYISD